MAGMRHMKASSPRAIRWRKGELIGAGAYGRVYMGMNLDSGELIAVKQVLVGTNNLAKEKAQAHIRELEEEVKLLQNLSHPNIVRYLGTAREEEALNIFLEFVPGGSIASLLGKFGSFTEPVIRMYTRQLLLGLEYLHKNKIMHRDIKGANILVDNQGHIKLADFGASKKVLELATISEAKSMKGTPYWMAPEVIRQTGHNWQADIWSVGCTVIEMATGKPPWSEQFQEVAALFHIGTTKSHPPIPEHLSQNAKGFLLKCLQREPRVRPSATELLKHPFVRDDDQVDNNFVSSVQGQEPCFQESRLSSAHNKNSSSGIAGSGVSRIFRDSGFSFAPATKLVASLVRSRNFLSTKKQEASFRDCEDELNCSVRIDSPTRDFSDEVNNSFNPMCEPTSIDCWTNDRNKSPGDISPGIDNKIILDDQMPSFSQGIEDGTNNNVQSPDQTLRNSLPEDDDEVTESKIRAFLDEKALELKKLQTPLYEEFNSIWRVAREEGSENVATSSPGKTRQLVTSSKSPSKGSSMSERSICVRNSVDSETSVSSGSPGGNAAISVSFSPLLEVPSPKLNEWRGTVQDGHCATSSPSFCERQRQWKEELQMELEMKREEKRKLARHGASPKDKALQRQGSRLGHTPPYSTMR